jgi:hypothetical protein
LPHESDQSMRPETVQDQQDELLSQCVRQLKTRHRFEAMMAEADSGMPSNAYDPLEQVLRDNPTLTREKAEEIAHAFGF